MPRIRALKPETPQDEKLAAVSRDARLTFLYCITQADDDGLLRGHPRQLLGALFPFDGDLTETLLMSWVGSLVDVAGVLRWRETEDGAPVLEIVNWEKHQQIKNRSKPFLAQQLKPLSAHPPEGLPSSSGDSPETLGARSPEVLKSRSPEVLLGSGGPNPEVTAVLEHYQALHPTRRPFDGDGKPKAPAQRAVKKALGWGFTADQLKAALGANAADAWHRTHKKHELEYVFRTEDKVRGWLERATTEDEPVYAGIDFVN